MHESLTALTLGTAHPDLFRVRRLYESAFPANERRPFETLPSGFDGQGELLAFYLETALRALSACSPGQTSPTFSTLPSRKPSATGALAPPRWNASRASSRASG